MDRRNFLHATAAISAGALAGCSSKQGATSNKGGSTSTPTSGSGQPDFADTTVTGYLLGPGRYKTLYKKALPHWEEQTGGTVKTPVILPLEEVVNKSLTSMAASENALDIFSSHNVYTADIGSNKLSEPLTPYLKQHNQWSDTPALKDLVPNAKDFATLDPSLPTVPYDEPKLVEMPRHYDVRAMVYRKDLFNDDGEKAQFEKEYGYELTPPSNWKQYRDAAEFFTRPDKNLYGTILTAKGESSMDSWMMHLFQNGGKFLDKENNYKAAMNSPEGVESLKFYRNMTLKHMPDGVLSMGYGPTNSQFRGGNVAMQPVWPGFFGSMLDSDVGDKIDFTMLPVGPKGSEDSPLDIVGLHTFGLNTNSNKKRAAFNVIDMMTSKKMLTYQSKQTGLLPVRKSQKKEVLSWADEQGGLVKSRWDTYMKMVPRSRTTPVIPEWTDITRDGWELIQKTLSKQMTPEKALAEMEKRTNDILQKAGYF